MELIGITIEALPCWPNTPVSLLCPLFPLTPYWTMGRWGLGEGYGPRLNQEDPFLVVARCLAACLVLPWQS